MPNGQPYQLQSDWYPLQIRGGKWFTTMPGFQAGGPTGGADSTGTLAGVLSVGTIGGTAGLLLGARFGPSAALGGGEAMAFVAGFGPTVLKNGMTGEQCALEEQAAHAPGGAYDQ